MQTIRIQEVAERTSKRGDKFLELRLADGKVAYVFDRSLFPLVKPGAELEGELEGERFPKLKAARVPSNGSGPAEGEPLEVRGNRALRALALRSACEVLAHQPKVDAERVLRWAEAFYGWLVQD